MLFVLGLSLQLCTYESLFFFFTQFASMPLRNGAKEGVIHSQREVSLGLRHFSGSFCHSIMMTLTSLETKREGFDVRRSDRLCVKQDRRIRIKLEHLEMRLRNQAANRGWREDWQKSRNGQTDHVRVFRFYGSFFICGIFVCPLWGAQPGVLRCIWKVLKDT